MQNPEDVLAGSPADFDSSLAYALHGDMRRLIIVAVVGSLLLPLGLAEFLQPQFFVGTGEAAVRRFIGLIVAIVGGAFLFGGLVAIVFKTMADAMMFANAR